MPDVFDIRPEELDPTLLRDQTAKAVRGAMLGAADSSPEAHAESIRQADRLGVPVDMVRRNPDWAMRQLRTQIDAESLAEQYPGTAKFLSDRDRAGATRDDILTQMALEDTMRNAQLVAEPGLFGKDVRDGLIKRLESHGHSFAFVGRGDTAFPDTGVRYSETDAAKAYLGMGGFGGQAFDDTGAQAIMGAGDTQPADQIPPIVDPQGAQSVELPNQPRGFLEQGERSIRRGEVLPFVGVAADVVDIGKLTAIADRIKENKDTDQDWIELLKYDAEIRRGTTFGGKVAAVLGQLPAFAGEFATTGGLYTAGKEAATKGSLFLAKKFLKKSAEELLENRALRMAVQGTAWAAGSMAQASVGMQHRVLAETMKAQLPQFSAMSVTEQGDVEETIKDPNDGFLKSWGKATVGMGIEVATERSGKVIGAILDKVPGVQALKAAVAARWMKMNPTKTWVQYAAALKKGGYDGVLEEVGEEYLGDLMKAAAGLEPLDLSWEEFGVRLVSFSVLPGAGLLLSAPSMIKQARNAAQQAQVQTEYLKELGAKAEQSKTRERMPGYLGVLGSMATENGPVQNLYHPVQTWNDYWTAQNQSPRQAAVELMGEQGGQAYDDAVAAGHDLEIPLATYVEKIAPTMHNDAISREVRMGSVEAPNVRELEAVAQQMEQQVKEGMTLNQSMVDLQAEKEALAQERAQIEQAVQADQQAPALVPEIAQEIAKISKQLKKLKPDNPKAVLLNDKLQALQAQQTPAPAQARQARIQAIAAEIPGATPEMVQQAIANLPELQALATPELAPVIAELQQLQAEEQAAQKNATRAQEITQREAEIDKQLADLETRQAEVTKSTPDMLPEVKDYADKLFGELMATGNTTERVARMQANLMARMAFIMATRAGMTMKEFSERFQLRVDDGTVRASATLSQADVARDAEYMAAVEAGNMETAQRLVDEAAKAAGMVAVIASFPKEVTPSQRKAGDWVSLDNQNGWDYQEEYSGSNWRKNSIRQFVANNAWEDRQTGWARGQTLVLNEDAVSADPITRDADGNVIPLSERFNTERDSILYQGAVESINTVAANVLADQKGVAAQIPAELVGKRFAPIMADLLGGGGDLYGVPLQGGPIYPIVNHGTGAVWASMRGAVAGIRTLLRRTGATYKDKNGKEWGLAAVYAMGQDAHQSNKNTTMVFLNAVEEAVRNGEITKKNEKKLSAMIRANSKATPSIKENSLLNTFPDKFNAEQLHSIIGKMSFDERAWLSEQLKTEAAAELGVPRIAKVLRLTRDESFQSIEQGSIINILKVDMDRLEAGLAVPERLLALGKQLKKETDEKEKDSISKEMDDIKKQDLTAEAFGVSKHLSYDTIIPGEVAVHFRNPMPLDAIAPDMVQDLKVASPKSHVQYLLGHFPKEVKGQMLTQEIVDGTNEAQSSKTRPTQAQAMLTAMNGGWVEYKQGTSRVGLTDFIRAIQSSDGASTLTAYDKGDLQADVKSGAMSVYKLGKFDVWFGIKNTSEGKELVGVVNNSGVPGMLNLIMAKALEEGANRLDAFSVKTDKMPGGMLESLYGRHGWTVYKSEKFNPKYAGDDLPKLKAFWASQGWDEARHGMPSVVYMSHNGLENRPDAARSSRPGADDRLGLARRKGAKARAAAVQAADGDAGDGAAPVDGAGAAGNAGAGRRLFPRGSDRFIAELRAATEGQLRGWGVSKEQQQAVLSAIDSQSARFYQSDLEQSEVFPRARVVSPRGEMTAAELESWASSHNVDQLRTALGNMRLTATPRILSMLGQFPEYLNPVVDYVVAQRAKLLEGKITAREVAKAYFITLSSIGSDAIDVQTIRNKTAALSEFNPDPMFLSKGSRGQDTMRPEEMAAWWFSTPMGQRALNAIEKGEIDAEAWENGLAFRDAYGRNDARERTAKNGTYTPGAFGEKRRKKNMNDILELTRAINETRGDSKKLQEVLSGVQGIADGKKGFVGHMLGMGDVATIDAVELNVWLTGHGDTTHLPTDLKKRIVLAKQAIGNKGLQSELFARIRNRISDLHDQTKGATGIPDDVAAHIIHHWIWDRAKGAETTHEGVYHAMQYYQNVDYRPGQLTEAAQKLKAGEITREEYNRLAAIELPLTPFDAVPKPATMDEVKMGLGEYKAGARLKRDMAQAPENIPAQTLESRLDIPAYREKGVWVVTLHEDRGDKSKGSAASPIAYTSTAILNNVTFKVHESAALNIASGKPKGTIATMRGDYEPMTADEAEARAKQAMQDGWVQVGMNPLRHSFFYDKADERPVVSAEQVLQIGGLVLAKNPVYGNAGEYLFQRKASPRGQITFNPAQRGAPQRSFTIGMLKKADASTFLHEGAHFWLEVFGDLATQADVPAQLAADYSAILKFLGVASRDEIGTEQHEKFARAFEAYLYEGKAPAEEVRGMFARMRQWFIRIYKEITNLNVDLSDDIRGVFDRMVATETEITAAEASEKVTPMFGEKPAEMSDQNWERYRKSVEAASLLAREQLQAKLAKEIRAARTEERKSELERIREEVAAELEKTREHIALALLRFGKTPRGGDLEEPQIAFKLDKQRLVDAGLDKPTMDKLRRLGVYRKEGGVDPQAASETLGFGSVEELALALTGTQSFNQAVAQEAQRRLEENHPSLMDNPSEIQAEAVAAVHNEYRDDVLAAEVAELQRMLRKDRQAVGRVADLAPAPLGSIARRVLRGEPQDAMAALMLMDPRAIAEVAKQTAEKTLAGQKLRDIRPALYLATARRKAQEAIEASTKGDYKTALLAKEAELLNHSLYREGRRLREEGDKQARWLQKLNGTARQAALGKAGHTYRDQINAILERFNFRPIPLSQVDRKQLLAEWISEQEAKGFTVEIDDAVRDEAFRKDYREMTAAELQGVYDAARQIDHLARLKNKLLKARDDAEFEAARDQILEVLRANTLAKPRQIGSKTALEKTLDTIGGYFAAHRKMASIVREMDGFVDNGPLYRYFMAPINEAANKEAVENEKAIVKLQELFATYSKEQLKQMTQKRVVSAGVRKFNLSHEDRLCIALNWGNEDNRKKLVDGYNALDEADVLAILDTLTEQDWKFVQSVWDYVDSFWPATKAKQERVYGIAPEKVEATPVVTKFGTFRGGYYPLKYTGAKAEGESDADAAKAMMKGAQTAASTKRGHTKERVSGVERPVRLDFGVLTQHVATVIHDLTHHETLIDVNKLLSNRSIMEAIEAHYGENLYRQLRTGIEAVAAGNVSSEDRFTKAFAHVRNGVTIAGLGFNLWTSIQQTFGLTNAIPRLGVKYVAQAAAQWIGSAKDMENSVAWIYARSEFMRLRGKTQDRELNELYNTINPSMNAALMGSYFYLIQRGQLLADVPTWLAGYHKAMDEGHSEEVAIQLADQVVIDVHGNGQIKDLATVQRGGPLLKMWSTFYSYFNAAYNMNVELVKATNFKSPAEIGRLAVDLLVLNSLPVALQFAILSAARAGAGDDEEWWKKLAKDQMSYLLGMMVFVREFGGIMNSMGYEGPAGARFFAESYKLAKQVEQGEADRGFWVELNKVGGLLFHYPSTQLQRTVEGAKSLWEGKTSNPAVLILGPTKEER